MSAADHPRTPNRVEKGIPTGGQFAASARAESDVTLAPSRDDVAADGLDGLDRADLLATPEMTDITALVPASWVEAKSDAELRDGIRQARASRQAAQERAAAQIAAEEAERSRRRSYRRPEWLEMRKDHNDRYVYSTVEGYSGTEVETLVDGKVRTCFTVNSPDGQRQEVVERVEQMAEWITADRAETAKTWTEAFPQVSPAARVAAFRGRPVETWLPNGPDGTGSYIAPDGSYVSISLDEEPTGNVFIDGVWADGEHFGDCLHSTFSARALAGDILRDGREAYEAAGW